MDDLERVQIVKFIVASALLELGALVKDAAGYTKRNVLLCKLTVLLVHL